MIAQHMPIFTLSNATPKSIKTDSMWTTDSMCFSMIWATVRIPSKNDLPIVTYYKKFVSVTKFNGFYLQKHNYLLRSCSTPSISVHLFIGIKHVRYPKLLNAEKSMSRRPFFLFVLLPYLPIISLIGQLQIGSLKAPATLL